MQGLTGLFFCRGERFAAKMKLAKGGVPQRVDCSEEHFLLRRFRTAASYVDHYLGEKNHEFYATTISAWQGHVMAIHRLRLGSGNARARANGPR